MPAGCCAPAAGPGLVPLGWVLAWLGARVCRSDNHAPGWEKGWRRRRSTLGSAHAALGSRRTPRGAALLCARPCASNRPSSPQGGRRALGVWAFCPTAPHRPQLARPAFIAVGQSACCPLTRKRRSTPGARRPLQPTPAAGLRAAALRATPCTRPAGAAKAGPPGGWARRAARRRQQQRRGGSAPSRRRARRAPPPRRRHAPDRPARAGAAGLVRPTKPRGRGRAALRRREAGAARGAGRADPLKARPATRRATLRPHTLTLCCAAVTPQAAAMALAMKAGLATALPVRCVPRAPGRAEPARGGLVAAFPAPGRARGPGGRRGARPRGPGSAPRRARPAFALRRAVERASTRLWPADTRAGGRPGVARPRARVQPAPWRGTPRAPSWDGTPPSPAPAAPAAS
jgi:hypothetical protein